MKTVVSGISVGIILFSFLLQADEKTMKILDKAYINAVNRQYKEAIAVTAPLLDSFSLKKIEEIVLAHQVLSISYCETGNKDKALEHYQALKAFSPNEDFRAFGMSEPCKILFAEKPATQTRKKKN